MPDIPGVTFEDVQAAAARVRDAVADTPMVRAHDLEEAAGCPVYLKCELFQVTGSFKARGALNWVRSASPEVLARGLVTISAGNHALALAWAARGRADLTVVMPEGSSPLKVATARRFGATVVLHGDIHAALARLQEIREHEGRVLVHPFDDPDVMAGQGTVGLEIARQIPDVADVWCPVGGGGLISGLALALKREIPGVRVVGLEPNGAAAMRAAWNAGRPVSLERVDTVAQSLAPASVGELSYATSRRWVDEIVTLPDVEIVDGLRETFARCRLYAEPGAVVGIAALLHGRVRPRGEGPLVLVVTGGNLDLPLARTLLPEAAGDVPATRPDS